MAAFDPYHQWLGIPATEQPPNHYRLLSVPLWESDLDVIDAAAERQTVFLRTFQLGPQAELAERILNEVARARVTLLNVDQKVAYDDQLRESLPAATGFSASSNTEVLTAEIDRLREQQQNLEQQLRQEQESFQQLTVRQAEEQETIERELEQRQAELDDQSLALQERQEKEALRWRTLVGQLEKERGDLQARREQQEKLRQDLMDQEQELEQETRRLEQERAKLEKRQQQLEREVTDREQDQGQQHTPETDQSQTPTSDEKLVPRQSVFSRIPRWVLVVVGSLLVSWALVLVASVLMRQGFEPTTATVCFPAPDSGLQQERDKLLAEVDRLRDTVEQQSHESQDHIQGLEQERDKLLEEVAHLRIVVEQRDRELQTLKDNTELPPESLVANLTRGLVAYYPFNGNVNDESGHGNHGEVHGATLAEDRNGKSGKAYSFDGSDDYISANGNFPLGSSPRSLTFWARPTKTTGSENIVGWGQSAIGNAFGLFAAHDLDRNGLYFYGHGQINTHDFFVNFTVDSKWHQYSIIHNGQTIIYFVDGTETARHSAEHLNTTGNTLVIGARIDLGYPFTGPIDDVRIYNRALSDAEVKALYNVERSPQPETKKNQIPRRRRPGKPTTPPLAVAPFKEEQAKQHQQDCADRLNTELTVSNEFGMTFVLIPPGEFMMGSPETEEGHRGNETQHKVQITKPFYLSAYEVTQAQYEEVMGKTPSRSKGATKPVGNLSWNGAMKFCQKLNEKEGEGVEYRLPTEAEWEYACRAGTTTVYSFGDDVSRLGDYAWWGGNSNGSTHPVGGLKPNAWGLFDMHGNVWEWCQDRYGKNETERMLVDPTGPESGSSRVLRGGAFSSYAEVVRAALRSDSEPNYRNLRYGFRLARTYPLSP